MISRGSHILSSVHVERISGHQARPLGDFSFGSGALESGRHDLAMPCDHGFESAGRTSSWTIGFPKDQMISEGIPGAYTAALGPSCRWQSLRWALRRARHSIAHARSNDDARCNGISVTVSPERSQLWTRRLAQLKVMIGVHCTTQSPASRPSTSLLERHRAPKSGALRATACRPRLRLHPELEERPSVSLPIGPMGRVACWDNSPAPEPPHGGTL